MTGLLGTDVGAFRTAAPAGRLLGLDLGSKTLGVAVSDSARRLATPVTVIARKSFAQTLADLRREIEASGAVGLVLGWPLNMDGSQGPRCQATKAFARRLQGPDGGLAVPILLWDERLSTHAAESRAIEEQNMKRKKRAKVIDALAAQVILAGALDALARLPHPES